MIYVDQLSYRGFKTRGVPTKTAHLTADSEEELHKFAGSMLMPKSWCHYGSRPHYDITAKYRMAAIRRGAKDGIAPHAARGK